MPVGNGRDNTRDGYFDLELANPSSQFTHPKSLVRPSWTGQILDKMGWTYNTVDSDAPTMGPTITGLAVAMSVLSLTAVVLRAYVRFKLIKASGSGKICQE